VVDAEIDQCGYSFKPASKIGEKGKASAVGL
jgi:hypothetical protein